MISDIIAQIEALRPPPPTPGTIEYARWLDGSQPDYSLLLKAIEDHRPPLVDESRTFGLITRPQPTPEFVKALMVASYSIPWLLPIIERNTPVKNNRMVWPEDYDGNILRYLHDTPLLQLFNREHYIDIPEQQRFAGTWVIAPSGKGKTTLLHNLILNDLARLPQPSIILMDSKMTGDLIAPFKCYQTIKDRLVLIEPIEGLALNPLSIPGTTVEASIGLMTYIFSGLIESELTPLQSTLFRYTLRALLESYDQPTIKDFQNIVTNGVPADVKLRTSLREFFDKEFPTQTYRGTREQLQWRLRLLLDNPIMESMLSCPETKIDLAKLMNEGAVIIINANKEKLSDIGSEFFQRFWIAMILNAAQRRQKQSGAYRPCWVYADECQTWAKNDTNLVTILDECRSARIGITLSHQRVDQLSAPVIDALANCAVKYANAENDAAFLAPLFRTKTENMRHKNLTFTLFVREHGTTVVTAPRYSGDQELADLLPQMTEEEWDALCERMMNYYQGQDVAPISTETLESIVTNTATDIDNISTEPTKNL